MRVLVIVASGLQAGYVGCYGNEWITTPNLDRLAAEGIVFDRHYADHPDPQGARRAWRTGQYHFPIPNAPSSAAPSAPDLIRILNGHDVRTILVVSDPQWKNPEFAQAWRTVLRPEDPREEDVSPLEQALEATVAAVENLKSNDRCLLWLDLAALQPPWRLPEDYRDLYFDEDGAEELSDDEDAEEVSAAEEAREEKKPLTPWTDPLPPWIEPGDEAAFLRLQWSYAGAVTYLDAGVGSLLDELRERELLDGFTVLVTSDRGQPLGEHGAVAASVPWLHEERVHLPLLLRLPGTAEAGRRVAALTQSVDLFPTVLDLFGIPFPPVHGSSLLPLCHADMEAVRPYACSGLEANEAIEWALRTPEWAFLLPLALPAEGTARGPQLYVKPEDRWEVNDILQHYQEWSQHLEQMLRAFMEASRQPGTLRPPELKELEAVQQEIDKAPQETSATEGATE